MIKRRTTPLKSNEVGALIVSPTRELARQIYHVFQTIFGSSTTDQNDSKGVVFPRAQLVVGGTDIGVDLKRMRDDGPDLVIATPGRLLDLLQRENFPMTTKELETLILDEADVLLDLGFEKELNLILDLVPRQRRTGLFSATQTKGVRALARAGMRNPVTISVQVRRRTVDGDSSTATMSRIPTRLQSYFHVCEVEDKLDVLVRFLRTKVGCSKAIVFVTTCACVDYFMAILSQVRRLSNISILGLHGRMNQKKRDATFKSFNDASTDERGCVLLCTDVAARGLDVPDVDWILQFDPPKDPDFFVHRIGRTARAGRAGRALLLLLPNETAYVDYLRFKSVPITRWTGDEEEEKDATPYKSQRAKLLSEVRRIATSDRAIMENGTRAFVSAIQAYKSHLLRDVFSLSALPLGRLANMFGLVQLPTMPELKRKDATVGFIAPKPSIDVDRVRYKNKTRERQRQERLKREKEERGGKTKAEVAEERRRQRDERAREEARRQKREAENGKKKKRKRKGKNRRMLEEWDALAKEERLYKRLKKGKISQREYDLQIRGLDELLEDHDSSEEEENEMETEKKKKKKRGRKNRKSGSFGRGKRGRAGNTRKGGRRQKKWTKR